MVSSFFLNISFFSTYVFYAYVVSQVVRRSASPLCINFFSIIKFVAMTID